MCNRPAVWDERKRGERAINTDENSARTRVRFQHRDSANELSGLAPANNVYTESQDPRITDRELCNSHRDSKKKKKKLKRVIKREERQKMKGKNKM